MEERMYLNSCDSCFSAEYRLLLWDNRRVLAYRKHTLWTRMPPKRLVQRLVDEIPEIGKCSCELKSDKSFYSWSLRKRQVTRELAYTHICMFKWQVPLGRSATSPKSPNGCGLAFMWVMLFILGLSSYISVLQTSTPSQAFQNTSQPSYVESIIRGCARVESVYAHVCGLKCSSAGVIEGLH